MTQSTHRMTRASRRGRIAAGTAAATAGALILAACGGGGEGDDGGDVSLTFTWWGDTSRTERYEESIDLFEEQNPGITIQTQYGSWGDYWTARNTEAAGGSLPDVMQMDIAYLTEYGAGNRLLDLEPHIGEQIDTSTLPESLMPSAQVGGTTYAIPTGTNTMATFFNTTLMAELDIEVPTEQLTWDEYHNLIAQLTEAGAAADPQVYGAVDYTRVFWMFQMWLTQQGMSMFTDDGQLAFTEADLAEWWSKTEDLRSTEGVVPAQQIAQLTEDPVSTGVAVSDVSWDNFLVRFSEGTGGDEFTMLPPPSDQPGEGGLFLKPSLLLAVGANSAHPEEAAQFIDFIVNDPEVSEIFGTSRGVPASDPAIEALSDAEGLDAAIIDYEESVEPLLTAAPPPPVSGFGGLEEAFVRIYEELSYGQITPAEAASQWFTEAQEAMS
ncbi:ABC transporter substrate-binding protein [Ruania halotolerans]|uniref:ABC transporter substrate-binding protein n=1 Tax=Ruania halotolerans TaxID=2897773 RepID=UPI001E303E90|nr:extracellular solute-binding protein [Ruania halotolerans]UFU07816.1 extracellular solute-binding protein [Ruania halotolerans]